MDVREFAALKEGDVIENHMGGSFGAGTVTAVEKMGVRVRWGEQPERTDVLLQRPGHRVVSLEPSRAADDGRARRRADQEGDVTAYEIFMTWLIVNELFVIWRLECAR